MQLSVERAQQVQALGSIQGTKEGKRTRCRQEEGRGRVMSQAMLEGCDTATQHPGLWELQESGWGLGSPQSPRGTALQTPDSGKEQIPTGFTLSAVFF